MRYIFTFYILFFSFSVRIFPQIPQTEIKRGIELGILEEYKESLLLFEHYQQRFPSDPAPHFFRASVLQSRMMDFETQRWREQFMQELDIAAELSDSLSKKHPDNLDYAFYYGAALAYKSFQLSREQKYIAGIRLASKAIATLERIIQQDSTFYDAYLGVGSYKYWRSYLTRHFAWLPFFSDQREEGIRLIQKACEESRFSKWAALSNLAWIYIQEERYQEAIDCAKIGLDQFPSSRFFLWPFGDALYHKGDYQQALHTYSTLLESVTQEELNNHYNEVVLHLKLAQCFYALGENESAIQHARQVLEIKADKEVISRLKEKRETATQLIAEINASQTLN